jgi:putative transposase
MVQLSHEQVRVDCLCPASSQSERHACRTVRCARASDRSRGHRTPRTELRQQIREMAPAQGRSSSWRTRVWLNREGWSVRTQLVYRLHREDVLQRRNSILL